MVSAEGTVHRSQFFSLEKEIKSFNTANKEIIATQHYIKQISK